MEIKNMLSKLYALGIKISVVNNNLKIQSSREKVPIDILNEIKANKNALIDYLNGGSEKNVFFEINNIEEKSFYLLSSAQKRLYLLQQMDLESIAYNMPYTIPLRDKIDKKKIEEVFRQLISRHESLRTSIIVIDQEPFQQVHENINFKVDEFVVNKSDEQSIKSRFIQVFDLSKAPLLRVAIIEIEGVGRRLMIDMHHIISDGLSHTILEKEFETLYSGKKLAPLKLQYKDYSGWQTSEKQKQILKKQEKYWLRKLEGEIPILNLPTDNTRPAMQSHEGATVCFTLNKTATQNLKLLVKENGITLYMSLLSVFNILLSKLCGQEDIIVGTPTANRNHSDLENIVGMFVNTLSLRNEINGNNTIKEFTAKLKQTTIEAFENQDYQFEDLVNKILVSRDLSHNPIFDVMFNLQNQKSQVGNLSELDNKGLIHTPGMSKFDLSLTAFDFGEQILLILEYCTKLFRAETIERYIDYFKRIVNHFITGQEKRISQIEVIGSEEKQQLLYEFNNTESDYPKNKTVIDLFEEQVKKTPGNIALIYGAEKITYEQLNHKANAIAYKINDKIIPGINHNIGLLFNPSVEMIASMLGVLKSGGAFVPLSPDVPIERMNYILTDSDAKLLLIQEELTNEKNRNSLPPGVDQIIISKKGWIEKKSENLKNRISPKDLIYIIYTSGTTGTPRGVEIQHQGLVNYATWRIFYYNLQPSDVTLQLLPYFFDGFGSNMYSTLLSGAALVILPKENRLNIGYIVDTMKKERVTNSAMTPVLYNSLLEEIANKNEIVDLRFIALGGEKPNSDLIRISEKILPEVLLINEYGPTEASIASTYNKVLNSSNTSIIGKPLSNTSVYILNQFDQLQPLGVLGELHISGVGLAKGYVNNENLTNEKFVPNPFLQGEKMYKTGDLARWLPDGNIEFIGRTDHQVKIRGIRVELEEIENVLQKHESIKESIIIAREDNGENYLCAYVVLNNELKVETLKSYLSGFLPDYMIPSYFVELDELPITSNGKINRKILPLPEIKAGDDYAAPSNEIEEKLVEIWAGVLNIHKNEISVTKDFFSIGGHSLKATVLSGMIKKILEIEFPVMEVFLHPTVRAQALQISTIGWLRDTQNRKVNTEKIKVSI